MTMKQKFIFIIILIVVLVVIISLGSYFGWQWYKLRQQNKIEVNLLKPQVIEYNINEDPKNWPFDFPKTGTGDFEVLSVRETIYSPTWVIAEKTLKTKYSKIVAFNFFKDYLNNTFWKINQEISATDQIQYSLKAEREGDISITINPAENNSSIINIKYEINPQNPKKPEPRQTFKELPQNFPDYLVYPKSKIGGFAEDKTKVYPILFSEDNVKLIYDFYIKNLKSDKNWEILYQNQNESSAAIQARYKTLNKFLKIDILPSPDPKLRSINITLEK
jgi:hypothetical protein